MNIVEIYLGKLIVNLHQEIGSCCKTISIINYIFTLDTEH